MNLGLKTRRSSVLGQPTLGKFAASFTPRTSRTKRLLQGDAPARKLDWILLGAAFALSLVGAMLVWSATKNRVGLTGGDPNAFLKKHLLNLAIGLFLFGLTAAVGHRRLRAFVPFVCVAVLGLLMATLAIGSEINGQKAWIVLGGGFSVQAGEFAKIAVILAMAMLLAERVDAGEVDTPTNKIVMFSLLIAGVPVGCILLMPDMGTIMVIAMIVLGVLLASGARVWWTIGLIVLAVAGSIAIWKLGLLSPYQINRFAAFANPDLDPQGVGYNTKMARLAIGSGELTGQGLGEGQQTSGQFVPEQQTDFIFSVAGEELGFLGCGVILLLFGVLLWRGLRIAAKSDDLYGTIIAVGVVSWLAFQMFENIGMNVGIMPVAGLPLPFVSYGGSSMFAIWIAIGLLQSVHMRGASFKQGL